MNFGPPPTTDETSIMLPACIPTHSAAPYCELFGSLLLANMDVSVRLNYLLSRLAVGVAESSLRSQILEADERYLLADRAILQDRVTVVLEAGAEGCMTILRSYIEEVGQAQIRCLRGAFGIDGSKGEESVRSLPFVRAAAMAGGRPRQAASVFSARG